ncbi:MAG: hypothetical protein IKM88_17965 [Lachnospiraceae bacterium]|nr:hypothetical protein [Clostridiales bacterium]MBR6852111.1 hypothetical protein [Lachnospiraceae bacterium]
MNKIISSFQKALSTCVCAFSLCIIILAFVSYGTGKLLSPDNIFILTWMFLCIVIIRTLYLSLEGTKRIGRIPYWIKRLIALPFYLGVTVIGIKNLACLENTYKTNLIFIIGVFGIVYFIASTIRYFIERKKTDAMTDALLKIQKEIEKENE